MGNHTKTITECITGINVDEYLVVDTKMDAKFWDLCKKYNLNYDCLLYTSDAADE